jgi:hypothetical protein
MIVLNNLDRYQFAGRELSKSAVRRSGGSRDGAVLDDHGASQALYRRARRGLAGGSRLALEPVNAMSDPNRDIAWIDRLLVLIS